MITWLTEGQPIAGMLKEGSAKKTSQENKIQDDTTNSLLKSVVVKSPATGQYTGGMKDESKSTA